MIWITVSVSGLKRHYGVFICTVSPPHSVEPPLFLSVPTLGLQTIHRERRRHDVPTQGQSPGYAGGRVLARYTESPFLLVQLERPEHSSCSPSCWQGWMKTNLSKKNEESRDLRGGNLEGRWYFQGLQKPSCYICCLLRSSKILLGYISELTFKRRLPFKFIFQIHFIIKQLSMYQFNAWAK